MRVSAPAPFPFVVGCGRSGTTMMRALLDAHREIAVPFESYFPVWMGRKRERYEQPDAFALDAFLADLLAEQGFQRWALDEGLVRAELAAAAPTTFADAVRASFALYARAHDKLRYADKTPVFVTHIPALAKLFPESVFVHLVRDGRDVAASRAQTAWGTDQFEFEALLWQEQVRQGRADGRALGTARYLEVRYEDLIADLEGSARSICKFIGADFDPAMLDYHERTEEILDSQPYPDEHRNLTRPPTKTRDWRTQLTAAQIAVFEQLAGPTLAAFGYEPGPNDGSFRIRLHALSARAKYATIVNWRRGRSALYRVVHRGDRQ